jgi:outer membrane receptor for ferrienterochelin and colicin
MPTLPRFALAAALAGLAFTSAARAQDNALPTDVDAPIAAKNEDFSAPPSVGQRFGASDVQWRGQGGASQWFARVSLGESSAPKRSLDGEVQWRWRVWDGQALTVGALVQHHLPAQGSAVAAVDQRFGAYVNNEWQLLPAWRVVLGARADRAPGGEQALAPRAALLWSVLPGLDAKLLDGVALREPLPQTLPSLGNERLRATELGLDWRAIDNLRLAASLYRNEASQTGDAVVAGVSQGPLQFQNLGRANGNGIELGSEFVADAGWQVRGSWAASSATDGEPAAGAAARTLARLQANSPLPWRGARAGFEWWRVGPQGSAADAQHLVNATLDWAPANTPWTMAAGAYNLTGRTLTDAGGTEPALGTLVRDGRRLQVQLARSF